MLSDVIDRAIRKVHRLRYRYDIFLSYSRADASQYTLKLRDELARLDYSCFLDQDEAPAGASLSRTLKRALDRSAVFVLVGSAGATTSRYVTLEISAFAESGRDVLPINIGSVKDARWATIQADDHIWIDESKEALLAGQPSFEVIDGIEKRFKYTRRNVRVRAQIAASAATVVIGALLAGYLLQQQTHRTYEARRNAEEQQRIANAATVLATAQRNAADKSRDEAARQEAVAKAKTIEASTATREADQQAQLARDASEKRKLADAAAMEQEQAARSAEERRRFADAATKQQRQLLLGNLGLPSDLDDVQGQFTDLSFHNVELRTIGWLTAPAVSFETDWPVNAPRDYLSRLPASLVSLNIALSPDVREIDLSGLPYERSLQNVTLKLTKVPNVSGLERFVALKRFAMEIRLPADQTCCAFLDTLPLERVHSLKVTVGKGAVATRHFGRLRRLRDLDVTADTIDLSGTNWPVELTSISLHGRVVNTAALLGVQTLSRLELDGVVEPPADTIEAEEIIVRSDVENVDTLRRLFARLKATKALAILLQRPVMDIDDHEFAQEVAIKRPPLERASRAASQAARELLLKHTDIERLALSMDVAELPDFAKFPALRFLGIQALRTETPKEILSEETLPSLKLLEGARRLEVIDLRLPIKSLVGFETFERLTDLRLTDETAGARLPVLPRLNRLTVPTLPRSTAAGMVAVRELVLHDQGNVELGPFKALESLTLFQWNHALGQIPSSLRRIHFGRIPPSDVLR